MKILLTGMAGFIGFSLAKRLIQQDNTIIGLDNINDYYSVDLKQDRLVELGFNKDQIQDNVLIVSNKYPNLSFIKAGLEDYDQLTKLFQDNKFDIVVNLAAQAGVGYSLTNPRAYINSNITGFFNILELSVKYSIKHLLYASSSSVYGMTEEYPFTEQMPTDMPMSLYAATKKSNELLAFTYSYLHNINTTGLRFFTVYGPWGRPDMMPYKTVKNIIEDKEITLYNNGELWRDYTYVEDIVDGIQKLVEKDPNQLSTTNNVKNRVFNIGHGSPIKNIDFVNTIAKHINKDPIIVNVAAPKTEVTKTFADTSKLQKEVGYKPSTDIEQGLKNLVEWYKNYYKVN